MPHRLTRTLQPSPRAQRIDRLMLPTVTLLLLLGAGFVFAAWTQADRAVGAAERKDEIRAERLAASVDRILKRRWEDLQRWGDRNEHLLAEGREQALQHELAHRVGGGATTAQIAWIVVRSDGTVVAMAEANSGALQASGIADDLRTIGRRVAVSREPAVSGSLKLGDEHVFASVAPVISAAPGSEPSAVLNVTSLEKSAFGAFLDDTGPTEVDEVALVDSRGRLLLGRHGEPGDERVRRQVGATGWGIEFSRDRIDTFLPRWAYPAFAVLLAAFALAYAVQDSNRRRLRAIGDARSAQVHLLYELAARVLHARSIAEQAEDLANTALRLVNVDGAIVHVASLEGDLVRTAGITGPGTAKYRVPIIGPREPVGELVVSRDGEPLDEEEGYVVQTAATLVGAAMHTLVSLETERAAASELQRLDELRSNLLATVAHELLSPLTAVKGVLGLMSMQDDLGERGLEYVGVATERTDRLVALIRDLFDCSLLETGQLDIRPRRQRADELLESALGAQAAARPGELRLSATPNLMITVDPVRFDQMVNNLVANAFRHGAPPVEVAVRPAENGALVIVSDEGRGIPEEDRAEIFGKFWQGSSGHARMSQGAGLGLSLVQGLVRVHGGDIRVDSAHADGRGARFTAFFPDATPVPEQPEDADTGGLDHSPTLV